MTPTDPDPDPSTPDPTAPDAQTERRAGGVDDATAHSTVSTELQRLGSLLG